MNEKFGILIQISLKFVPKGSIDNKSVLVHEMAWRRTGDKPLPKPILPQFTNAYMRRWLIHVFYSFEAAPFWKCIPSCAAGDMIENTNSFLCFHKIIQLVGVCDPEKCCGRRATMYEPSGNRTPADTHHTNNISDNTLIYKESNTKHHYLLAKRPGM